MTKREITKALIQIVVGAAVGSVVDKALVSLIPTTSKYKMAEMTGMFAGWYVTNRYENNLNQLVDNFYDKRESR